MSIINPTLDAQFSACVIALNKGQDPTEVASALLDTWGHEPLEKAKRGTQVPGDHGIPEIGRQEKAFRDALTAEQRKAYDDLKQMVYALFRSKRSFDEIDPWKVDEPIESWKRRVFRRILDEPMKAYMLGQMLADAFIERTRKKRVLMPTDKRAIKFLQAYTLNEISSKLDDVKGSLRRVLIEGVEQGWNPVKVADEVRRELDDYETAWDLIAITETSRAESQGRLNELRDAGVTDVIGSSAHDPRTCEHCKRLIDGHTYAIADVIGKSNYGRKAKDYLPVIPLHPRCRCVWLPAP